MISLEAIALESGTVIQSFKYCDSELSCYTLFMSNITKPPFCSGLAGEDVFMLSWNRRLNHTLRLYFYTTTF